MKISDLESMGAKIKKEKGTISLEIGDGERTIELVLYDGRAVRISWCRGASYAKQFFEITKAEADLLKKIEELHIVFDQNNIPVGVSFRLLKPKLAQNQTQPSPPLS